jgi:hypothetical protein
MLARDWCIELMLARSTSADVRSTQFPARSINHLKSMDNWKMRSLYIHSEIVKYEVYVDALKTAISTRFKKQGERKLEKSLKRDLVGVDDEDDYD